VGHNAGSNVTTGDNNIHIGNQGTAADSGLIRIGTVGTQTATFIAGISGQTSASGVAVLVNAAGQLGTTTSSQRAKDEIRDMSVASDGVLKLRPVTFRYKPEHDDGSRLLQYGLIAEEVAEVYPELAVLDKDGQPSGVRYHVLPAMLLNELQRQQRQLTAQQQELDELRAQVRALIKERAAIVERNVDPERR
jgi:Chaperone of endosialidase